MDRVAFLEALLRIGAEEVNKLSLRIGTQARDGEPLGELDIMNDLNRIAEALANAGGVPIEGDREAAFHHMVEHGNPFAGGDCSIGAFVKPTAPANICPACKAPITDANPRKRCVNCHHLECESCISVESGLCQDCHLEREEGE